MLTRYDEFPVHQAPRPFSDIPPVKVGGYMCARKCFRSRQRTASYNPGSGPLKRSTRCRENFPWPR